MKIYIKFIRLFSIFTIFLLTGLYLILFFKKSQFTLVPSSPTFETSIKDKFIAQRIKINSPTGLTKYAGVNLSVDMRERSSFVLKQQNKPLIEINKTTTTPQFRATLFEADEKTMEANELCYMQKRDGLWIEDKKCNATFNYVPETDMYISFALGGTQDPAIINREGFGLYIQKYPDNAFYTHRLFPLWEKIPWNLSAVIDGQEILLVKDITVHYFPMYFIPTPDQ